MFGFATWRARKKAEAFKTLALLTHELLISVLIEANINPSKIKNLQERFEAAVKAADAL